MVLQTHRVSDNLHTIVKASIVFYVYTLLVNSVGNISQLFCITIIVTAFVDFKLYTEVAVAVAIENGFRLEAVIVNIFTTATLFVTIVAIRVIIAIIKVVCVIVMKCASTTFAVYIIILIASFTQNSIAVNGIVCPNSATAVFTYYGFFAETIGSKFCSVKIVSVLNIPLLSAVGAYKCIAHFNSSYNRKWDKPCGLSQWFNILLLKA